ncbi:DUF6510 family protein [Streptomyces sp. NPDC017964]|uniref:DUF6510 family protein n=1 Tax=Streptomyces sp. NPDC017964 TaxID=3365022 RepID=UPI003789746C
MSAIYRGTCSWLISGFLRWRPSASTWGRCSQCRLVAPMAELHIHGAEPALTGRCPGCGAIALRLVRQPEHVWLQLGTLRAAFRFDLPH